MPPKIRQLIKTLEMSGFKNLGGKGSHRKFRHPDGLRITVSGKPGDDAKSYQILEVRKVLESLKNETS
jgi:predicted RNA binding protein YcfA (HicA-like mRNA interferase family)